MTLATGGVVTEAVVNGVLRRIHTFTSSGNLVITDPGTVDYLIVAGGGGGSYGSGGGGGGGVVYSSASPVLSASTYSITVGAGGAGGNGSLGSTGQNSSIIGSGLNVSALGGGGGGPVNTAGGAGGSGGGAGYSFSAGPLSGGNTTQTSGSGFTGYGSAGGGIFGTQSQPYSGAGGGGAGEVGGSITTGAAIAGAGGAGRAFNISGTNTFYSGGGAGGAGGSTYATPITTRALGGGGAAGGSGTGTEMNGIANTGGGGAADNRSVGSYNGAPGSGGSGVVIISYSIPMDWAAGTGGVVTEETVDGEKFRIHTFTSSGEFVVNDPGLIEYLVVAGGGGGGGWQGGGGGAGGFRTATGYSVPAGTYSIIVGAGGTGQPAGTDGAYTNGSNSVFDSITSTGGGRGGNWTGTGLNGQNGGSGGGGSYNSGVAAGGGTGIAGQGNNGGIGTTSANYGAGGGGGASAVGGIGTGTAGGTGGAGTVSTISGNAVTYAGGGGGGGGNSTLTGGAGGAGGGGAGGTNSIGISGTVNTGGGGGGAGTPNTTGVSHKGGGAGGSGVVILRYSIGFVPDVIFEVSGNPVTAADEGSTVTVRFIGAAATGAINYTITGVSTADIGGASLTGTVDLVDYQATITLVLTADSTIGEGAETMNVSFVENSITYQADLTINDTSSALSITPSTAAPGETVTVALNTVNSPVADGTEIPYTISGQYITAGLIDQPLTGVFVVNNNTAQFTIVVGYVASTTLSVTSLGTTATCAISFTPTITDIVVQSDYTDTEVETATFSILPFSSVPITLNTATNVEPGFVQISTVNYVNYAKPTTVTETVENGGALNMYIIQPLGLPIVREYWI